MTRPPWPRRYLRVRALLDIAAKRAWADAEFGAKGVIEVRDVAKAAIERDVGDPRRTHREPHRRFPQARAANEPMRRHARKPLERSQEMVGTEARRSRQVSEREPGIGMALESSAPLG